MTTLVVEDDEVNDQPQLSMGMRALLVQNRGFSQTDLSVISDDTSDHDDNAHDVDESVEVAVREKKESRGLNLPKTVETTFTDMTDEWSTAGGLSAAVTEKLFPYHVIVNHNLIITSVGQDFPRVLHSDEEDIVGVSINDVLAVVTPKVGAQWSWDWLRNLDERSFTVQSVLPGSNKTNLRFKAQAVHISDHPAETMLTLSPDTRNLDELHAMNLNFNDLPVYGGHRDILALREKLNTQKNNAVKLEKLSIALKTEQALLESLLPRHVAEGLRKGENVEPMQHDHVTMFFSDVVGFTDMCKQMYPWQVVGMLNRLYCVMDYLAGKFNLFKVETIGDAYVCCSGLPVADTRHAENVACFAIAVTHCCKLVHSPVDSSPIRLRIGIHTGPCASGVVGVMNPRYCVFGDTVNCTARHESTGEAGKVHCSSVTQMELVRSGVGEKFTFDEREAVDMKGKGKLRTYWLGASASNNLLNEEGMTQLEMEVQNLLNSAKFESKLERENSNKSIRLLDQLEHSSFCSDKSQEVLGPILALIKREISNKSMGSVERNPSLSGQRNAEWNTETTAGGSAGLRFPGPGLPLNTSLHSSNSRSSLTSNSGLARNRSSHSLSYLKGFGALPLSPSSSSDSSVTFSSSQHASFIVSLFNPTSKSLSSAKDSIPSFALNEDDKR